MAKKENTREECLRKAAEIVCGERENQYGSPEDSFVTIAALWSAYLKQDIKPEDVAMLMALLKIARISKGVYKANSFIDLAGYAACGMEIASKQAQGPQNTQATQKDERTYIVTEVCPNCENEIEMRWNTDALGYKAICPVCGGRLMLCDECQHSEVGDCDYNRCTDSCRHNPVSNKKLWIRLGVTMNITDNEAATILGGDGNFAADTLRKIIAEGRAKPEGDSYIPAESIENYNKAYETNFNACETGFDL